MNTVKRLAAVTAVTVSTGLALAVIVLGAALVTDAVTSGDSGGNFADRMARIMGTDNMDASPEDALGGEGRQENLGREVSIPVYHDGFTMDCSLNLDAKHSFSDDVFVVSCPDSVIYVAGMGDEFILDGGMYLQIESDPDPDYNLAPFGDENSTQPPIFAIP